MQNDFRESLMSICKGDYSEYEKLKRASCEDFLTRYKLFIDEIEIRGKENGNG